jgi:sugar/nucleoside kinase (ribokinase family)
MDEPEFRLVTRNKQDEIDNLIKTNSKLFDKFKYLIITQGKKGCFLKKNKTILHVPCVLNTAIDSTGAGDIFLSMFFTLETSKLFSDYELLIISHIAAGLHSNQIGNRFRINVADIYKVVSSMLK